MSYRVLIVDDQKEVSRMLRSALETIEQGLVVSEAFSGEEAILEAIRKKIDLLVSDFRLPGINGVELIKKFRVFNPELKVIVITGVTDPRLLREAQNAGADAFFQKPIDIGDFLDAVEQVLGMTRTIVHKEDKPAAATVSAIFSSATQTAKAPTPAPVPAPQPLPPVEEPPKGLAGLLVGLRKDLDASAVILMDNLGHIQAEAGQLSDPASAVSLTGSLMGILSAAQKVAGFLDHNGSHLHLFNSSGQDGIFLPVGPLHALFVVGKGLADPHGLPARLDRLYGMRASLLDALKLIGLPVEAPESAKPKQRSAAEEVHTQFENLPRDFLSIFGEMGKKTQDADAFWDSVVEKGTTFAEPDKLTYEQASKLGLTPDS